MIERCAIVHMDNEFDMGVHTEWLSQRVAEYSGSAVVVTLVGPPGSRNAEVVEDEHGRNIVNFLY